MLSNKEKSKSIEKGELLREKSSIEIFFTTFLTVFIAELGDKTQLATLLLSAESGKPLLVFLAASLALVVSSLVGVFLGQILSSSFEPETFEYLAGVLMIIIGVWLSLEVLYSQYNNLQIL